MPVRHAILRQLASQETLVLKYSSKEEDLVPNTTDAMTGEEIPTILSQDQLRSLDSELAAYPLYRWSEWKALVSCVQDADIVKLVGPKRKLDSLFESPADDEVVPRGSVGDNKAQVTTNLVGSDSARTEGQLSYASFDLRRSWRKGAVGEEVTTYSKDKSWLLQHVIREQFGGGRLLCSCHISSRSYFFIDCLRLLAQLQLAFVIFINVQNFSSLLAFKRFLGLLARSERIFSQEDLPKDGGLTLESVEDLYVQLLQTLSNQLQSLPDTFFTVDLAGTGLQDFWREELLALSTSLVRGHSGSNPISSAMEEALANLRSMAQTRFQWDLGVEHLETGEDEDSLEEGEDAPVIVDL
jgi:A1 cistron-splicing factor AAR2